MSQVYYGSLFLKYILLQITYVGHNGCIKFINSITLRSVKYKLGLLHIRGGDKLAPTALYNKDC